MHTKPSSGRLSINGENVCNGLNYIRKSNPGGMFNKIKVICILWCYLIITYE